MDQTKIQEIAKNQKWGFLRETKEKAIKDGLDKDTGLFRTGLEEYLAVIFPDVNDWVHDETIPNCKRKIRPDYRSESLNMVIEFDGPQHYQNPEIIIKDKKKDEIYKELGYKKIVRIPFFIQLSKDSVKTLFGVDVDEDLFNEMIPSFNHVGNNPATFCPLGIERCAKEFLKFPNQYKTNRDYLKTFNDEKLTSVNLLDKLYKKYKN